MSIFSKDKVVTVAQRFDAAIDYIRSIGDGYEEAGRLEDVLSTFKSRPDASAIKPAELCADIVECIIHNKAYSPGKYLTLYNTAEMLYQAVFVYDDETPDFDKLRLVFLEMYRERGVVEAGMFDLKLFNSFNGIKNMFTRLAEQLKSILLPELENIAPTMSCGVVFTDGSVDKLTFEDLYQYADEALRQSKKFRNGAITINELRHRDFFH